MRNLILLRWGLRFPAFHSSSGGSELQAPGPTILAAPHLQRVVSLILRVLLAFCWQLTIFVGSSVLHTMEWDGRGQWGSLVEGLGPLPAQAVSLISP